MKKRTTRLSLSKETVLYLSADDMKRADGGYPPSGPRSCACQGSGASQCVCSLDVSVCW